MIYREAPVTIAVLPSRETPEKSGMLVVWAEKNVERYDQGNTVCRAGNAQREEINRHWQWR